MFDQLLEDMAAETCNPELPDEVKALLNKASDLLCNQAEQIAQFVATVERLEQDIEDLENDLADSDDAILCLEIKLDRIREELENE